MRIFWAEQLERNTWIADGVSSRAAKVYFYKRSTDEEHLRNGFRRSYRWAIDEIEFEALR